MDEIHEEPEDGKDVRQASVRKFTCVFLLSGEVNCNIFTWDQEKAPAQLIAQS